MSNDHSHSIDHTESPSDPVLRVKALESILIEKGLVDPAALDALVDAYENKIGPRNGAAVDALMHGCHDVAPAGGNACVAVHILIEGDLRAGPVGNIVVVGLVTRGARLD